MPTLNAPPVCAPPVCAPPVCAPQRSAALLLYRVFIRDLLLSTRIGVHAHEQHAPQRVRINAELDATPAPRFNDDLRNAVCYDEIIQAIAKLAAGPHIQLAETLAERILALCLADERVRRASVTVEKLDVYGNAGAVGVTLVQENS